MSNNLNLELSTQESMLLKSALLHSQPASKSWQAWLATLDFENDSIPAACFLLLTLVYKNLAGIHPEPAHISRLKGIYRQAWYRNHLGLQRIVWAVLEVIIYRVVS